VAVRGIVEGVGEPSPSRFVLGGEVGWEAVPGHQVKCKTMHGGNLECRMSKDKCRRNDE